METSRNLKPIANTDTHNCFACSPSNPSGLHMEFFTDGQTIFSWLTVPDHLCGWNNVVHGGVVATILDEVMSWAAIHFLKQFVLTRSITTQFKKPVFSGEPIKAEGRVIKIKGKREALLEGAITKGETLCAKAEGSYALLRMEAVKRLGILDEEAFQGFQHLISTP